MTLMFVFGQDFEDSAKLPQGQLLKSAVLTDQLVSEIYTGALDALKAQYFSGK